MKTLGKRNSDWDFFATLKTVPDRELSFNFISIADLTLLATALPYNAELNAMCRWVICRVIWIEGSTLNSTPLPISQSITVSRFCWIVVEFFLLNLPLQFFPQINQWNIYICCECVFFLKRVVTLELKPCSFFRVLARF